MIEIAVKDRQRMVRLLHGRQPLSTDIRKTSDDVTVLLNYLQSQGYAILNPVLLAEVNKAVALACEPHMRTVLAQPNRAILIPYYEQMKADADGSTS